ncbi:MAG: DUF4347 domain-containing protein [Myxacorys californica WJT36-NPBG1]|jgi:hypothetical protein|nr:DUF4347 domain-containing protein [Myxacorys californica WJT36-NPBG1]
MNFEHSSTTGLTSTPNTSSDRISHPLLELPSSPKSAASGATSLLFIDTGVNDYQSLLAGVQPNTEVHVLDSSQDAISEKTGGAIAQITQTLTGRADISSVHILSHGSTGSLKLGSDWLSSSDLERYSSQFQSWAKALTTNADILLYGCDVAQGVTGRTFVQQLAQLTGADVAASDNVTGNNSLGGNWNLEYRTGAIEAAEVLDQTAMSQYSQTLGDIIINEFQRTAGSFTDSEYIEFLLTADLTATQLEDFFFGDSNGTTFSKLGIYSLSNLSSIAPTFKAGTIIVVAGSSVVSAEDTTYNPIFGGTDEQWNVRLKFGGLHITGASGNFAGSEDAAWIDSSNAGTTSIHSIAYKSDAAFGAFGDAATIKLNVTNADLITQFNGNGSQTTDSTKFSFAPSGTLGLPNGGDNSTYITSLRNPNAPLTAQASSVTLDEGSTHSFQASDFKFSTSSSQTLQQVQLTQLSTIGQLFLDADSNNTQDTGEAVTTNQIITLADIPKLKFQPVANANGFNYANFKFKVSDGQVFSTTDATMTLNVNSVNDSPVLNTSGSPMLPSIYENASNPTGISVSDLIGTSITDVDFGAVKAIALTGADNSNGKWQFSTNGGATWTDLGNVSDTAATLLGATPLYTSALGNAPDQQNWFFYNNLKKNNSGVPPFVPGNASQTASVNGTLLNSTANLETYAGYSNYTINPDLSQSLKNPTFPVLDRAQGYSLSFNLQVLAESHTNPDRGVAVILLGDDNQGIELGVQFDGSNGRIFAQSLDVNNQFVGAEAIAFNTNKLTDYMIKIQGTTYQLFANGTQVLTGALRDYRTWTSPDGFPSPYGLKNFVFLGDTSTSAQSSIFFNQVVIQTDTRVRFVPNADFVGNATFSFRAWDITNGAANGTTGVNASLNGGISAFSSAVETAAIAVSSLNAPSSGWKIEETADFNRDGVADILWRNSNTGEVSIWKLDVNNNVTYLNLPAEPSADWTIKGFADSNNDGFADILWHNSKTGGVSIWMLNDLGTVSFTNLSQTAGDSWQVQNFADFDGDGKADILWRDINRGLVSIWKLDGANITYLNVPAIVGETWQIKGFADFNGDGVADILWHDSTRGLVSIWELNAKGTFTSVMLPPVAGTDWQIQAFADFDGNGNADILWHNSATHQIAIWKSDSASNITYLNLPEASTVNWQINGFADFNKDGFLDILWYDPTRGLTNIWKLNSNGFEDAIDLPAS